MSTVIGRDVKKEEKKEVAVSRLPRIEKEEKEKNEKDKEKLKKTFNIDYDHELNSFRIQPQEQDLNNEAGNFLPSSCGNKSKERGNKRLLYRGRECDVRA